MAKILKLTGLASYVNQHTETIVLKKGETARFSDTVAAAMLKSTRMNAENEAISYWTEVTGEEPTYDFSKPDIKAAEKAVEEAPVAAKPSRKKAAEAAEEDGDVAVATRPVATQRKRTLR